MQVVKKLKLLLIFFLKRKGTQISKEMSNFNTNLRRITDSLFIFFNFRPISPSRHDAVSMAIRRLYDVVDAV